VFAEDVLIIHESYGNTHIKWKNRLEDNSGGNHTVTSVTSMPADTSSYEQIYDIRYSNTHVISSSMETHYKALLARGGTLYLQTEHTGFGTRNNSVIDFIEDELGGGTITYGSSNAGSGSITQHNSSGTFDTSFSGTLTFVAAGKLTAIGNGEWIAKTAAGDTVAAVWYGSDLSNAYTGKVIVVTDINYASHSTYYTNTNKNWMNHLRAMVVTSFNSTPTSSISTAQQTVVTNTRNASNSNNKILITQAGTGVEINITQDGTNNLVAGPDLTNAGSIVGDYNELTITQTNNNNIIGIDIDGNSNDVDITQNTDQRALIDIAGASNTLNLNQSGGDNHASIAIVGNSNVMDIDQTEAGNNILFLDVDGSNNVTVDQKGSGAHYLEIQLTDSHTLDITQDGSGDHAASINLSGNPTTLNLTQDSSTDQNYMLSQTCTDVSCSATVTQN
jgi:hypothetical protein